MVAHACNSSIWVIERRTWSSRVSSTKQWIWSQSRLRETAYQKQTIKTTPQITAKPTNHQCASSLHSFCMHLLLSLFKRKFSQEPDLFMWNSWGITYLYLSFYFCILLTILNMNLISPRHCYKNTLFLIVRGHLIFSTSVLIILL